MCTIYLYTKCIPHSYILRIPNIYYIHTNMYTVHTYTPNNPTLVHTTYIPHTIYVYPEHHTPPGRRLRCMQYRLKNTKKITGRRHRCAVCSTGRKK